MNTLEDVCLQSLVNWIDAFPKEIPEHNFSKEHIRKINELIEPKRKEQEYKVTKNTLKFLLIAAVILSLTITAFAIPTCREFIVEKFFNHSEYNVVDTEKSKDVNSLIVDYIPEGFQIDEVFESESIYDYYYTNEDKYFHVKKFAINGAIYYDTEVFEDENIKINGIDAVFYNHDNQLKGFIFNDGKYIYEINGNIDKNDLVQIAQNIE